MAVRNLNHTGRRKIPQHRVALRVNQGADGEIRFEIDFTWGSMKFEGDPKIRVEAYNKDLSLGFDCGTVNKCVVPSQNVITNLGAAGEVKFRVKIVKDSDPPLVLARVDGLHPEGEDDNQEDKDSIISVMAVDLGSVTWRLDYPPEITGKPILYINKTIADGINKIKKDPVYAALILPTIVRQVFTKIVLDKIDCPEDEEPLDNPDSWHRRWVQYAESEMSVAEPDWDDIQDLEGAEQYIDEVTQEVSRTFDLLERLVSHEARNEP